MRDRYERSKTQRPGARGFRKERKGDWCMVVMANADATEPRPHIHCQRCDERLVLVLPIRIDVVAAMSKAFVKSHSGCLPKAVSA